MLSNIMVDYYGSQTPLGQVANVNTPDARTISIQPWEKQMLAEKRVNPLKICNFGFSEKVNFFLKKINIKGSVQKTVKKYLAQVI